MNWAKSFRFSFRWVLWGVVTTAPAVTACSQTRKEGSHDVGSSRTALSGSVEFELVLPSGVPVEQPALWSSHSFAVRDGVRIVSTPTGAGLSVQVGTADAVFGNDAITRSIASAGRVFLWHRVQVNGSITTESTLVTQGNATISGLIQQNTSLNPRSFRRWRVEFPASTQGNVTLPPDSAQSLTPGAFQNVVLFSRSALELQSGRYTFESLQVEPQAKLRINGPVVVFVRTGLNYKGSIEAVGGSKPRFMIGYAGQQASVIDAAFRGTIVAPFASITLAQATHRGQFFARELEVRAHGRVEHVPFEDWGIVNVNDFDDDGIDDGLDNCPTVYNPDQADANGNGLGDACDSCPTGPDQDMDGICDDVDNCPSVYNPDQLDMSGNGTGDVCDAQRCYSPVTDIDRQRALTIALSHSSLQSTVAAARFRAMEFGTVCPELGSTAARRIKLSIYDYVQLQNRDLVVNLDAQSVEVSQVTQRQPQGSQAEYDEASAIAATSVTVQQRIAATGAELDLTTSNVTISELCPVNRCVDIIYARRVGEGAVVPPEPYNTSVRWVGTLPVFRALVDLNARQVLSVVDL